MAITVELRVVELLNARLCHELISPVGAINNGIELMEDAEDDPGFAADAMRLIATSAKTAARRLDFYRFAYGSGRGSSGRDVALGLLDGGKARGEWVDDALPLEWQRLACNLFVIAAEALPRGGTVQLQANANPVGVTVRAAGDSINLPAELRAALTDSSDIDALTARTVHGYYSARIAETLGAKIAITEPGAGRLVLGTTSRG
jgi:histidine phosphotransferase ChpT